MLVLLGETLAFIFFLLITGWTVYMFAILIVGVRELLSKKEVVPISVVEGVDYPFFSLIVPMKDERRVIERLLQASMQLDYPKDKFEVVIVEDGSTHNSLDLCKKYEALYPGRIRYFYNAESKGKPAALNYGLKWARGDIIGVYDADNIPEPDSLLRSAEYFRDPKIVALQGSISSTNPEENMLTKFLHYELIVHISAHNSGKDRLGLFVPLGGTCQFVRKTVLEEVGGWRDGALSEDMEISAKLVKHGHQIKFAPEVRSWQENPSKFKELFRQRTRWARGCMDAALKYGSLLKNLNVRSLDAEAYLLAPFLMVPITLSYILNLYGLFVPFNFGVYTTVLLQALSLFTIFTLFTLGVAMVYASKPRSFKTVKWLPFMYVYWMTQIFASTSAFLQIIFKRPPKWKKTTHTGYMTAQPEFLLSPRQPSVKDSDIEET